MNLITRFFRAEKRAAVAKRPAPDLIETLAEALSDADEERDGCWPEFEGDDGFRGNGYIRILDAEQQDRYRRLAMRVIHEMRFYQEKYGKQL